MPSTAYMETEPSSWLCKGADASRPPARNNLLIIPPDGVTSLRFLSNKRSLGDYNIAVNDIMGIKT